MGHQLRAYQKGSGGPSRVRTIIKDKNKEEYMLIHKLEIKVQRHTEWFLKPYLLPPSSSCR